MTDNHTPEERRMNMSHIRSKNTNPEETLRKALFREGFRYRKNVNKLPGCPDIVLTKYKTVIFVNGCFWHMHDCGRFRWPETNKEYWRKKILRNVERDKNNISLLEDTGWNVITIWECELKKSVIDQVIMSIKNQILIEEKEY